MTASAFLSVQDVAGSWPAARTGPALRLAPTVAVPEARPVVFDGLFGWLHLAPGRRGVVLCGAHGYEQTAAHRAWRDLAERIAAAGCPALRFDYPGEGDSAELSEPRLSDWLAAIAHARRVLRDEAGADEIALVGLRCGATLAALAAAREPADRLVLIAPFATGRAFRREMEMRAGSINRFADGSPTPSVAHEVSLGGFAVPAGLLADLDEVRLAAAAQAPAPAVLLVGEAGRLAAHYAELGCEVATRPLPDLAALVGDPIFTEPTHGCFAEIAAFLAAGADPRPAPATGGPLSPPRLDGPVWSEEPVRSSSGLFGILCAPRGPAAPGPSVVLLPTGKTARFGWGRQATRLARELAAGGIASLRVDLRGIGDAADRPDGTIPLFAPDARDDVRAAIDLLAARFPGPVVLAGTCSGAYAAFHASLRDDRVGGVLMANLPRFDWNPDERVEDALRQTYGRASTYAGLLRRGETWGRLLRGRVGIGPIAAVLAVRAVRETGRWWKRLVEGRPGGSVGRRIRALRARGVELRLVFSEGDPGLPDVLRDLGRSRARAGRLIGAPLAILPGADHNLATESSQRQLGTALRGLLRDVAARRPAEA